MPRQATITQPDVRSGPRSVRRIVLTLEALCDADDGVTLSELASRMDAPKTSLVELLAGLTAEGCVERDAAGRYHLGSRFISLALRAASGRDLVTLARPLLVELVEVTGETVVLGILSPDRETAIYLDKVETDNPIRYTVSVGERRELYCTGVGKILLAYLEPDQRQKYIRSMARERFTTNTITSARALQSELARVRREGIARTIDERFLGASGIAAPIYSGDGRVMAAMLVAGPSDRVKKRSAQIEEAVREAADELSRLVGGSPA